MLKKASILKKSGYFSKSITLLEEMEKLIEDKLRVKDGKTKFYKKLLHKVYRDLARLSTLKKN
jgi:hypothetical protein